jgi:hypothetical protein
MLRVDFKGPGNSMSGIFISYRRSDSAGHTGRLADDLGKQLDGQALFRDIEAIEAGVDFVQALEKAVAACSVMLVIIGPTWANATTADGQRRLHQPGDFVRMEIEAALARDIRVIPVLVGDAQMPGPTDLPESMAGLLRRNAYSISDRRWQYDVSQLLDILVKIPGVASRKSESAVAPAHAKAAMSGWLKAALVGVGVLIAAAAAIYFVPLDPPAATPVGAQTATGSESLPAATAAEPASFAHQFYGDWVSADGEVFNIDTEEDTGKLYVFAGSRMNDGTGGGTDTPPPDAPGQDLYGNGSIDGRRLQVTLVDQYSNEEYAVAFELSKDASTLIGSITRNDTGKKRELSLRRR